MQSSASCASVSPTFAIPVGGHSAVLRYPVLPPRRPDAPQAMATRDGSSPSVRSTWMGSCHTMYVLNTHKEWCKRSMIRIDMPRTTGHDSWLSSGAVGVPEFPPSRLRAVVVYDGDACVKDPPDSHRRLQRWRVKDPPERACTVVACASMSTRVHLDHSHFIVCRLIRIHNGVNGTYVQ